MANTPGSFPPARLLALLLVFILAALPARAAEEILSYRSTVEVAADGTLSVSESIRVRAEGNQIRRGIYRDFPLRFEDERGRLRDVSFEVVEVTRDGRSEPWREERRSGLARVYVGDADTLLAPGEYDYTIRYETDRQIRFFETHDEVYWNVTGNGWIFPIRAAEAGFVLPPGGRAEEVAVFTGRFGETGGDARAALSADGSRVDVATTRPLGPQEGLTVAIRVAKGVIAEPSAAQQRAWFFRDNAGAVIGFAGLLLVLAYYAWAWNRVGRDPPAGVVVPRWDAPEGVSPALSHYIDSRGFSGGGFTALSAAALSLAVKGYVTLDEPGKTLTIRRTEKPQEAGLPPGERAILAELGEGGEITLDRANGTRVQTMRSAFVGAIEREHRGEFYRRNIGHIALGIILSVGTLIALVAFGGLAEETMASLIVPVVVSTIIGSTLVNFGKSFRRERSLASRIISIVIFGFVAATGLTVAGGFLSVVVLAGVPGLDMPLLAAVGALVLANVIFFFLMGAPTPLGAKLATDIEGLKQYIRLAETERLNMQGAPEMSPRRFETILPYAVALGLERPWSRAFEKWLAAAAAAGTAAATAYGGPTWFTGSSFDAGSVGSRLGGLGSSMANSLSAAMPPAQSSSSGFSGGGGGGGFSGGGGGGGGGGGW